MDIKGTSLSSHRGIVKRIYWLPLKAIEFSGGDTTSFLKRVFLMYLFILIDFWESFFKKKTILLLLKNYLKKGKFLVKSSFSIAFGKFLGQLFS